MNGFRLFQRFVLDSLLSISDFSKGFLLDSLLRVFVLGKTLLRVFALWAAGGRRGWWGTVGGARGVVAVGGVGWVGGVGGVSRKQLRLRGEKFVSKKLNCSLAFYPFYRV